MARLSRSDARQSQQLPKCVDRPMGWVRRGAIGAEGSPGYLELAVARASRSALSTVHAQQSVAARRSRARWSAPLAALPCAPWARPMVECQWFAMHVPSAAARRGMLCTLHTAGCSGCVCVCVGVSVLIDSEPRSCSHAVGRLAHARTNTHSDGRPPRWMTSEGGRGGVHFAGRAWCITELWS